MSPLAVVHSTRALSGGNSRPSRHGSAGHLRYSVHRSTHCSPTHPTHLDRNSGPDSGLRSKGCTVVCSSQSADATEEVEGEESTAPCTVMGTVSLARFLAEETQDMPEVEGTDLAVLLNELASATKLLGDTLSGAGIQGLTGGAGTQNQTGDKQQKLDVVANEMIKAALSATGQVRTMASEEEDTVELANPSGRYAVVFDPLDGSRNIDAAIPTGTIFGVYLCPTALEDAMDENEWMLADCLQPGVELVAAGYALYSSATMLVLTLGNGTHGFTLDRRTGDYVLTHPNILIPERGQIYSVNDARYHDWPSGLQRYIDTIRKGEGQNPKQYSARYICSLVADFHRTLLYGGVAMNPRSHLRLVYEANPLALLAEQAGGLGSDGKQRILGIEPTDLHQRLPLFLGSPLDITELESYGDVQQEAKTYEV